MHTIKINAARPGPLIPLGKQGENEAVHIEFDVSAPKLLYCKKGGIS